MFEFVNLFRKCFFYSYWLKISKVSIENLTNDSVVPIIRETDFEMDLSVMSFQEHKNAWKLLKVEKLETRMKPENKEDKFAVAAIGGNYSIVGHLMEGKTGKFAKTIFYSLRVVHIINVTFLLLVKQLIREMVKVWKYHVYRHLQDGQICGNFN